MQKTFIKKNTCAYFQYDYDSEGDVQPKPSPANYTDCWGDHHVKMPCSIHNDYAVEGKVSRL